MLLIIRFKENVAENQIHKLVIHEQQIIIVHTFLKFSLSFLNILKLSGEKSIHFTQNGVVQRRPRTFVP